MPVVYQDEARWYTTFEDQVCRLAVSYLQCERRSPHFGQLSFDWSAGQLFSLNCIEGQGKAVAVPEQLKHLVEQEQDKYITQTSAQGVVRRLTSPQQWGPDCASYTVQLAGKLYMAAAGCHCFESVHNSRLD